MKRLLWLAALLPAIVLGQDDSPIPQPGPNGSVSIEQIDIAIAAVEAREGLVAETQSLIIEQLRAAQAQIRNRLASEQAAEDFASALESAPPETEAINAALETAGDEAPAPNTLGIDDETPLGELERALARSRADLSSAETAVADLQSRYSSEENRPEEARARIEELRGLRSQLESSLSASPPPQENPLLTDARRLATSLRLSARTAELAMLDQENASHSVRIALLGARLEQAESNAERQRDIVSIYQEAVNTARLGDVAQLLRLAAEEARAVEDQHPAIQNLAQENVALVAELPEIVSSIRRVTTELGVIEDQSRRIGGMLDLSRQRLEIGGMDKAIGNLFFEERRNLPQVSQYRQQVREQRQTLTDIGLAQVRIIERQRALRAPDERIEALLDELRNDGIVETEIAASRDTVESLIQSRRDILSQMSSTYTTYLRALGDLDSAQRNLLEAADNYKNFLDKYLLWIPNADVVGLKTLKDLVPSIAWVVSPSLWLEAVNTLPTAVQRYAVQTIVSLLLIFAIILSRPWLKRQARTISTQVGHLSTDKIGLTLKALAIAFVVAVPIPFFLWLVGWELQGASEGNAFPVAVSAALLSIAPFMYNVRVLRLLSVKDGVFSKHFGWDDDMLAIIRRQLDVLMVIAVPVAFVTVLAYQAPTGEVRDSFGRLGFVALMSVFAYVLQSISHPLNGVMKDHYEAQPDQFASRLRWVWHVLAFGTPLLLAFLALAGFLYTSGTLLTGRLIETIWLLLAVLVANQVVLRWLALARRRLAFERAIEARAKREAEREKEQLGETDPADDEAELLPQVERTPVDLDQVDQQTRRLLSSGLFVVAVLGSLGIWSEMLPVFSLFNEVNLWNETITVDGIETQGPVTLTDLLLAIAAAIITWIASRNLPGLLEIAVLRHLELQPGSRYTIVTLVRYAVVTAGLIFALNTIGWNWSRIQWLAAGLTVGLGFGLQEIVANFVSGLIILFERPVRVGDTVTVGQLTGNVSKVRIRATTITDWDRKEIIVPNKAFITDQVINWTLSDPITRLTIDVGVSYSSDVVLAQKVIEDALKKQPLILEEPAPAVYFMGFSDSSLDFKIYVYARQLADRFPIFHAVHQDVLQALRDNGIEIPFPQRDLHIRSAIPELHQPTKDDS